MMRHTQSRYMAGMTIEEWREAGGNLGRTLLVLAAFVVTIYTLALWA